MGETDIHVNGHLDEAQWEQLACDELSPDALKAARAHISACLECTRIDRALCELREEAGAFDPGVPVAARRRVTLAPRWIGAIAAGVLAVVAVGLSRAQRSVPPAQEQVRGAQPDRPDGLSPRGPLVSVPTQLRWSAVPHATGYVVTVYDSNALPAWTSPPLTGTQAPWPQKAAAPGTWYWQVTALPSHVVSEMVDLTFPAGR